jgi:hypothetical protein
LYHAGTELILEIEAAADIADLSAFEVAVGTSSAESSRARQVFRNVAVQDADEGKHKVSTLRTCVCGIASGWKGHSRRGWPDGGLTAGSTFRTIKTERKSDVHAGTNVDSAAG